MPNLDLFTAGDLTCHVIAIDIVGLERRLLRKILGNDVINDATGLGRKDQLPAKDALRRQPKTKVDVSPFQFPREQEAINLQQEVAHRRCALRSDWREYTVQQLKCDFLLTGGDHQSRPPAPGEEFCIPFGKQVHKFVHPPSSEAVQKLR
ncbi:hypothetical protein [Bradyrhizobium sp. AZCC 1678]|uniref:hypothetical protein n=1 Tax=Bradyrhizobium sp. AZCC 1678 TaxID=3117030 RepID=UPI002FEED628